MLFKCKNCGGNTVYAPDKGKMYCPHCESIDSEEKVGGNSLVQCVNCGAPIQLSEYTSACRCEHCGTYLIFDERVEEPFKPGLILPFRVSRELAVAHLEKELKNRLFAPADFLSAKSLEKMEGVYVPFWLYDYDANYDFAGEGTQIRTWRSGNMEYTETSYYEVGRKMEADFERVPVDASYVMEDGVMDLMEPYRYQELTDFEPKYMSGFLSERYNQREDELADRAEGKVREASENLLQGSLTGYATVRPYHKNLRIHKKGTCYALMPVWQYVYRYRDKTYQYHVNGQTGKVVGVTPVSRAKVLAYGASVFVMVTAICSLAVHVLEIL
ncbi:MAG: hypothetical protein HFI53_09395 [Lachnospiraceae bacterium]|nr:hypothetical protein [Lachnospiraceae bacterium]